MAEKDPTPPLDDEANDAKLPEPDQDQGNDVKNEEVPQD